MRRAVSISRRSTSSFEYVASLAMSSSYGYVAYIDEAGDDGIGKFKLAGEGGMSHWLILTACLISAENELNVVKWRDEITAAFPKRKSRDIHFQSLDHSQRVYATSCLGKQPVGLISVLSNKTTIAKHPSFAEACAQQKNILYKYLLRYLLERVTDAVRRAHLLRPETPTTLKIIFSRRGGMDYRDFQDYLATLKALQTGRGSYHPVHWPCISHDLTLALDHSKVAGLQLADIAASAFYQAVEPNFYGFTEPRYALLLRDRVLSQQPRMPCLNYGLKPVPNIGRMTLSLEQMAFFKEWGIRG